MIPIKGLEPPVRPTPGTIVNALWSSAIDAFVKTILLLVMGNVALALLGGVFHAMAPSAPPFLAGHSGVQTDANSASIVHYWWSLVRNHQFLIVYAIMLLVMLRTRLIGVIPGLPVLIPLPETRLQKVGAQISKNWFRLIIGNAFGALTTAIVVYFVERFTGAQILLGLLLAATLPALTAMATFVVGSPVVNFIGGLFAWYGDNQLKFNFWVLYLAAVSDDLGIPNLKTLAHLLWTRLRSRPAAPPPLLK